MEWFAGLGLIAVIVGGGYFIGYAMFRHAFPLDWKDKNTTMRQVADRQSIALSRLYGEQPSSFDGHTERDWLQVAARHLMSLWPWIGLDYAVLCLKDYMPDEYGHPDYDWSKEMAEELATEYARNFGEEYGANQ
jgi:hypothetical protein